MPITAGGDPHLALEGKRVAFAGKLGGVTRREAQHLVRHRGGVPVDESSAAVDLIVIGADQLPLGAEDLLDDGTLRAAAEGRLEIISETQLWHRLGLVDGESGPGGRRLYTPAMLADLLSVPVSIIRRWHRRGLIVPAREVHRLPYFDFQEIATARSLAQLLAAGASPGAIEQKLEALARHVPNVERPLAQLSAIVEGQQILLRQGDGLIEPGGQLRIDFESLDAPHEDIAVEQSPILGLTDTPDEVPLTPEEILDQAAALEDSGQLESALDMMRAALAATGPSAELCFRLAELLYRLGDISAARERYYMAIELDEDFIEARANLGCILAETGQRELAVAAFQGALRFHGDYPDVHYHLASTLDELDALDEAETHWQAFLSLAPDSPWAEEARTRLESWS